MKINIIDLLNMISKHEKIPKTIKYYGNIYEYIEENEFYYDVNGSSLYREFCGDGNCLDDEVEIIEEDKTIKKIGKIYDGFNDSYYYTCLVKIVQKVDEVIDAINELKADE